MGKGNIYPARVYTLFFSGTVAHIGGICGLTRGFIGI